MAFMQVSMCTLIQGLTPSERDRSMTDELTHALNSCNICINRGHRCLNVEENDINRKKRNSKKGASTIKDDINPVYTPYIQKIT